MNNSEKELEEFRNKKKQEEQTMKQKLNRNDFKPGNTVEFAGQKWNVLEQSREEKETKSHENGYKKMNKQIIKDAIKFHGADEQTTVCMEECAELIQAISKEKRGKNDVEHLTEEIADVIICIEILKQVYKITDDRIQYFLHEKQKRIVERMESEEE